MASGWQASVSALVPGKGHLCKMAGGLSCSGLGEWKVMVEPLPTFRYEFPNRLQHHDYLPGEPLPPAPGPLSLIFQNCLLAASVMQAEPCSALLARGLRPSHLFPELGEGVEFAAFCALLPSCPGRVKGHMASAREPVPWEKGAVPKAPRSFWTETLTHELGESVLPGADCTAGPSGLAPGYRWELCRLVVKCWIRVWRNLPPRLERF